MENANVKLTKAQKFEMLLALPEVQADAMLVEFINHEVELLAKKSGKKAKTEDVMKIAIAQSLTAELQSGMAIMGLIADQFEDISQAKVTARLSALVREGVAVKEALRVGKSTIQHYRLADTDDVA